MKKNLVQVAFSPISRLGFWYITRKPNFSDTWPRPSLLGSILGTYQLHNCTNEIILLVVRSRYLGVGIMWNGIWFVSTTNLSIEKNYMSVSQHWKTHNFFSTMSCCCYRRCPMLLLEEMTMMVVPSNSIPDGVLVGRRHNFYYKNSILTMTTNLEWKKKLSVLLLGQKDTQSTTDGLFGK